MTLSKVELEERWSLADACEAHDVLDQIDDAKREAYEAAKKGGD